MTPSLGFINLLEQLTELRKTIYLLDYQFIIKDITQEQPDGRYGERGVEFSCPLWAATLPTPPCVHQPGSSWNPVL